MTYVFACLLTLLSTSNAWYLTGFTPREFCFEDKGVEGCNSFLPIFANRLESRQTVLPYEYSKFGFCPVPDDLRKKAEVSMPHEGLSQILFGERIETTAYAATFGSDSKCDKVCDKTYSDEKEFSFLRFAIQLGYQQEFIIDNLPVVFCFENPLKNNSLGCETSFPVGCYVDASSRTTPACSYILTASSVELGKAVRKPQKRTTYIVNHLDIEVYYHNPGSKTGKRIVSAKVYPRIKTQCNGPADLTSLEKKGQTISFTKSVTFIEKSDVAWSSRWDHLLTQKANNIEIQWYSIVNSIMIILFLSGMVGMVLVRTLHKDIARYNNANMDDESDVQEDFGWKLVHGDVFRPPAKASLLAALLGSGAQIFCMAISVLFLASIGLLSPARRGSVMTAGIVIYLLLGTVCGYVSAVYYKACGGVRWFTNLFLALSIVPGFSFLVFFILNLIMWGEGSSAAVPFWVIIVILVLWLFVQLPLVMVGGFLGFRRTVEANPVRTNQIPRQIPPQPKHLRPWLAMLLGSVLSFGCFFTQLYFIMNSIWGHHIYYMFGFCFLVFLMLLITTGESCVLVCYLQLCAENYHWQWQSFLTAAGNAVFFLIYCVHFYINRSTIVGAASTALFFGYSFLIAIFFGTLSGTIGFFACKYFVTRIYGAIKLD